LVSVICRKAGTVILKLIAGAGLVLDVHAPASAAGRNRRRDRGRRSLGLNGGTVWDSGRCWGRRGVGWRWIPWHYGDPTLGQLGLPCLGEG
jgi:hypothetical protein